MRQIFDQTLGTAAHSFDVDIPGTGSHIFILIYGRDTENLAISAISLTYNGDFTQDYYDQEFEGHGTQVAGFGIAGQWCIGYDQPGTPVDANTFAACQILIPNCLSSVGFKTAIGYHGWANSNTATNYANDHTGARPNTDAITHINIAAGLNDATINFVAGSRTTVYMLDMPDVAPLIPPISKVTTGGARW